MEALFLYWLYGKCNTKKNRALEVRFFYIILALHRVDTQPRLH